MTHQTTRIVQLVVNYQSGSKDKPVCGLVEKSGLQALFAKVSVKNKTKHTNKNLNQKFKKEQDLS